MKKLNYLLVILFLFQVSSKAANYNIESVLPAPNSFNVPNSTTISVKFNLDIDPISLNDSTVFVRGSQSGLIPWTINYDNSTRILNVVPGRTFRTGETVTVLLSKGIRSISGASSLNPFQWSFIIKAAKGSMNFDFKSRAGYESNPRGLSAVEFYKNGALDIGIANEGTDKFSLLQNDGKGGFTQKLVVNSIGNARAVAFGDFNNDGFIDAAVANYNPSGTLVVLKNNNSSSFSIVQNYSFTEYMVSITTADFNGDGYLDIAAVNDENQLFVMINNHDWSFSTTTINLKSYPRAIASGDLDGDGNIDIVCADGTILFNDANGNFSINPSYSLAYSTRSVQVADFNGDGKVDIITGDDGLLYILKNDGNRQFTKSSIDIGSVSPYSITAGDFDCDNDIDLACVGFQSTTEIFLLKNDGDFNFSVLPPVEVGVGTNWIISGDWNNDNSIDLAVALNATTETVAIFENVLFDPNIIVTPSTLSFGSIQIGDSKEVYLRINNNGVDSVLNVNISASNSVFTLSKTSLVIPPDKVDSIMVKFTPISAGTNYIDTLILNSNDRKNPKIKVLMSGGALLQTPVLLSPVNGKMGLPINPVLTWNETPNSVFYILQVAADSLFQNLIFTGNARSTSLHLSNLSYDSKYFWRIKAVNNFGQSYFSGIWSFITTVSSPKNLTVTPGNKKVILNWTASNSKNILRYRIYRKETFGNYTFYDSTITASYTDQNLLNGVTCYYKVTAVNNYLIESPYSNEVIAKPFNQPPQAALLKTITKANGGKVLEETYHFSSEGSIDVDGKIDSTLWFVNDKFEGFQNSLDFDFKQGSGKVTLVVKDNDGASDTSIAWVHRSMFIKNTNGPVYAGLSMYGENSIYAIAAGDAIYRMNASGTTKYSLGINGSVSSSCSIAYDSSLYINSSDKFIYAFSKEGNAFWNPIFMGGELTATPTIDSILNMVYTGVSNNNFVGINRLSGKVIWNYFTEGPIKNSAVISNDRKLIVASQNGRLYGFDLNNISIPVSPKWQISLPDTNPGSLALDNLGNIYLGTSSGYLMKISFPKDQQPSIIWQIKIDSAIVASPVIDADNTLYIGSLNSKFYSVDINSGSIKWIFKSNSGIRSTASISSAGNIYFGNDSGEVFCLDKQGEKQWYYISGSSIFAPLLYSYSTLYIGTTSSNIIAIYDGLDSKNTLSGNAVLGTNKEAKVSIWPTFQGNNQRTGCSISNGITNAAYSKEFLPKTFWLGQNYPNPFNPRTKINFNLPTESYVAVKVFNSLGEVVTELMNTTKSAGYYEVEFEGVNMSSGIYFYAIESRATNGTQSYREVKKMILLK